MRKSLGFILIAIIIVAGLSFWYYKTSPRFLSDQAIQTKTAALVAAGDASKCGSVAKDIKGYDYQKVCENLILYNEAYKEKSFDLCAQLDKRYYDPQECGLYVFNESLNSVSSPSAFCDNASIAIPDYKNKDNCLAIFWGDKAAEKRNIGLCSTNIQNSSFIGTCELVYLSQIAGTAKSSNQPKPSCSGFTSSLAKSDCENYVSGSCSQIVGDNYLSQLCAQ